VTGRFLAEPDSHSAEPFRTLRLAIESRATSGKTRGLLFTSPRRHDGRSTIAANYAVVTALIHRPVLLIDADMRNPSLHTMFDRPRTPGLVDALRERLDVSEVAHVLPGLGGLQLLTVGSQLSRPGDVVASPAMSDLLERAYEHYEAVIIDSPPALLAADASGLASHPETDVVMVVNRSGKRKHLVSALSKLALTEARVLGTVVNRDGSLTANH
jgi:capsular exopolysaccharide synthesis family protein